MRELPGQEVLHTVWTRIAIDERVELHVSAEAQQRLGPGNTPDEDGIPASERIHPEYAASVPNTAAHDGVRLFPADTVYRVPFGQGSNRNGPLASCLLP
jgi:hypothetical protein